MNVFLLMMYSHSMSDISENCVIQQLKVSHKTIFTDRINPIFCRTTQSVELCKKAFNWPHKLSLEWPDFPLMHKSTSK
jgi:hypothetical protein